MTREFWSGQQDSNLHQPIDFTTGDSDQPGRNRGESPVKPGCDSDRPRKRPPLSAEEKAFAIEKRELGWSCERIARSLGCSAGSVSWHCLQVGADPPNAKPIDTSIRGPMAVVRNGKLVRRYSPEEDRKLVALSLSGKTHTEIGRELGRRPNSVRGRLMTLARHEARLEARGGFR